MGKEQRSLRDGNGRVARLARWLATPPMGDRFTALVLEHKEDGAWTRVQMWKRDDVTAHLATVIDSIVTETANELGAYMHARVVWFDIERDAYGVEHPLRVQPEGFEGAQAFSGDAQSQAIQNQRHQERMFTYNMDALREASHMQRQASEHLGNSNQILARENERLREELYAARTAQLELENQVALLTAQLEEAVSLAERGHEQKSEEQKTGQVLSMIASIAAQTAAAPKAS